MRIKTNFEELYIKGEKSGSETVTLTSSYPISISIDEYTKDLNGSVSYSISGNGTSNVSITFTYSNLYVNGETYSATITAVSSTDALNIPVVINCSDTLIYTDMRETIDVLDGIHINYNSTPDVNKVSIVKEDNSEINISNYLTNQSVHISYSELLSKFGVIDYKYLIAENGLSQISNDLKKVVYEFEHIYDNVAYVDYHAQDVIFQFKSLRNGEPSSFIASTNNNATCKWWMEGEIYYLKVSITENFGDDKVITTTLRQNESQYELKFYIMQGAGVNEFYVIDSELIHIDENGGEVSFNIKSTLNETPLSPQTTSNMVKSIGLYNDVYKVIANIPANNGSSRKLYITFTQPTSNASLTITVSQAAKEFNDNVEVLPDEPESGSGGGGTVTNINLCFYGWNNVPMYNVNYMQINDDGSYTIVTPTKNKTSENWPPGAFILDHDDLKNYETEPSGSSYIYVLPSTITNWEIKPLTQYVGNRLFYGSGLKELVELNLDITSAHQMFRNSKIKQVGTTAPLNMTYVKNASWMFYDTALECAYLNGTENITDAYRMFSGCEYLKNINGEGIHLNLLSCEDAQYMFSDSGIINVEELVLSNKCRLAPYMFYNCSDLTTLPLIDCSGMESCAYMFRNCISLTNMGGLKDLKVSLDLSQSTLLTHESLMNIINNLAVVNNGPTLSLGEANFAKLTDREIKIAVDKGWIIDGYDYRSEFIYNYEQVGEDYKTATLYNDLSSTQLVNPELNGEKIYSTKGELNEGDNLFTFGISGTYGGGLFKDCTTLKEVKYFNTSNLNYCEDMFRNCTSLISVPSLSLKNCTSTERMFEGCTSLKKIERLLLSRNEIRADEMFFNCTSLTEIPDLGSHSFGEYVRMFANCTSLTEIPKLSFTYQAGFSPAAMEVFGNCTSLKTFKGTSLSFPNAYTAHGMFYNCTSLETVPAIKFPNSKLENTSQMFHYCTSLVTAPTISNMEKVTRMSYMFDGCTSLVNVPHYRVAEYDDVDLGFMFRNCTSLVSAPYLSTTNIGNMKNMYQGCTSLMSVPNYDTSHTTDMSNMFEGCTSLVSLPDFRIYNDSLQNCSRMFANCTSLTDVPLKTISSNYKDTLDATYMFANCTSLTELNDFTLYGTDYSPLDASYMFANCTSLTKATNLCLTPMGAKSLTCGMFYNCTSLTDISLSRYSDIVLNKYITCNLNGMFWGCTSLTNISGDNIEICTDLDFSDSPLLTHDSLMWIINRLEDSYNHKLKIGTANLNKLTQGEIKKATDKGWVVS